MEKVFCGWVTRIKGEEPPNKAHIPLSARFEGIGARIQSQKEAAVPFPAAACDISQSKAAMTIKARTQAAGQLILQHNRENPLCQFTLKPRPADDLHPSTLERIAQAKLERKSFPVLPQSRAQAIMRDRSSALGKALIKTQDAVEAIMTGNMTAAPDLPPFPSFKELQAHFSSLSCSNKIDDQSIPGGSNPQTRDA